MVTAVGTGVGAAVGLEVGNGVGDGVVKAVGDGVVKGVGNGVEVGVGVGLGVADGTPPSASRYACPNSVAGSIEVPSPHSLKVVTNCHGSPEAIIAATFARQRVRSRVRRGLASSIRQKPGLMLNE